MDLKRLAGRALATLSLSMLCLVTFAQERQVTVVDGTGETVIGANVLVVGTTNGVITDMDGSFTLLSTSINNELTKNKGLGRLYSLFLSF